MANIELTSNSAISDRNIRKALRLPETYRKRANIDFGDWLPTLISLDGEGYKYAMDSSRGPNIYYFQGKYRRTYFLWLNSVNDMQGYMFYYDHTTGLISDHYQVTEPIAGASDNHTSPAMMITNDGYIITCCEELQSSASMAHNSPLNIYVSSNPEDPSSIDPSTPTVTLGSGGTNDSYSYPYFAKLANNRILLVARQGLSGNDHYRKAMWYSDDNGATWNPVNSDESDGDFLSLGDHASSGDGLWAYGYFHDTSGDYVALIVDEMDHEDPVSTLTNHYLLFTKDGETWGNVEWMLDLEGSWSTDATSVITRTELINNCLAVGLGDYTIGSPSYGISVRDMTTDYFGRPYLSYKTYTDTTTTFYLRYFDVESNQWLENDITSQTSETLNKYQQLKVVDEEGEVIDLFTGVDKTYSELRHFRTKDKGQTMALIEEMSNSSGKDHIYLELSFNSMKVDVYCVAANFTDGTHADIKIFIGDSEVSQADVKFLKDQTINSGTLGDLVSFDGTNWDQADADTENLTSGMLGIIIGNNTVLRKGIFHTTGLTAGDTYYVSSTAGGITNTKPSSSGQFVRAIGYAYNSRNLIFDPEKTYIEIS